MPKENIETENATLLEFQRNFDEIPMESQVNSNGIPIILELNRQARGAGQALHAELNYVWTIFAKPCALGVNVGRFLIFGVNPCLFVHFSCGFCFMRVFLFTLAAFFFHSVFALLRQLRFFSFFRSTARAGANAQLSVKEKNLVV